MKITNNLNLPRPFVEAVTKEYQYKEKRYSVTTLLKGTREAILQRRHDNEIEQDASDMINLLFGTAVHSILENSQEEFTQLKEVKLVVEMPNGYELSGKFDLFDVANGVVTDYKTATVWKVIYNDWDDYRKQCLIYCWMLRKQGYDAHRGEIVALLKDFSKTKAKREANYPKYPVHRIGWDFKEEDFLEIERWLYEKFIEIEINEKLSDEELFLCSPEERWTNPTQYAVMKMGNKRAIKLYEVKEEAEARVQKEGPKYYVEERKGEDKKCVEYCNCCDFCSYYKENYASKNEEGKEGE